MKPFRTLIAIVLVTFLIFAGAALWSILKEETQPAVLLEDGTSLLVDYVNYGTEHTFSRSANPRGWPWLPQFGSVGTETVEPQLALFISQYAPSTESFRGLLWLKAATVADSHGCVIGIGTSASRYQLGRHRGAILTFNTFPREKQLTLQLYGARENKGKLQISVPENARPPTHNWKAASLPATQYAGDLEVTLQKLNPRLLARTAGNVKCQRLVIHPDLQIRQNGQLTSEWFVGGIEVESPSGNRVASRLGRLHAYPVASPDLTLCRKQPAWKLTLLLFRKAGASFQPNEQWQLKGLQPPAKNKVRYLANRRKRIQDVSIDLFLIAGPGTTTYTLPTTIERGGMSQMSGSWKENETFHLDSRILPDGTRSNTVTASTSHLLGRVSGFTNIHAIHLEAATADRQPVQVHEKRLHKQRFWWLAIPPDSKEIDLRFVAQTARQVSFYISPPSPSAH